ncbi:hypothetical protein L873DRAFT_270543 [Choiromyces venosus 120613-1]|uniref:Uncharacterized protein n=1 Tax=Choiromyces venosus 120613-1 TaxID=1336337 RepID=A0A3N4J3A3_9PEZI|nr:hypothetical protein L873DRAFT_270543 [Choiromyces venosus 120613-1]
MSLVVDWYLTSNFPLTSLIRSHQRFFIIQLFDVASSACHGPGWVWPTKAWPDPQSHELGLPKPSPAHLAYGLEQK